VVHCAQFAEPSVAAKVRLVHAVHGVELPAALLVPGAQKLHAWFVVLVPGVLMYLPAAHCVHGTHSAAPEDEA
jgi:hypothetical protein